MKFEIEIKNKNKNPKTEGTKLLKNKIKDLRCSFAHFFFNSQLEEKAIN